MIILILVVAVISWATYYLGFTSDDKGLQAFKRIKVKDNLSNLNKHLNEDSKSSDPKTPGSSTLNTGNDDKDLDFKIEEYATNLNVPWSIAFTSNSRMLVTERPGQIIEIVDKMVNPNPLFVFSDNIAVSEAGLMGMAVDPDYQTNKFVYVCYTYDNNGLRDKIVRLKDLGDKLVEDKILLENIPAAKNHAGCKVKIGPDNKLYITTGDATTKSIAQDKNNLGGKILRLNLDGKFPIDNPFGDSPIFTIGHRNAQGIDWTTDGTMFAAEHGPSGNDGPGGGDEINIIKPGSNYGWPLVSHQNTKGGLEVPLLEFTPAIAPSALMIYKSDKMPDIKDNIFVAMLKGQGILRIVLNSDKSVNFYEKTKAVNVGRVREIIQSPGGDIYFTTSNKDGRGKPRVKDDIIYRLYL